MTTDIPAVVVDDKTETPIKNNFTNTTQHIAENTTHISKDCSKITCKHLNISITTSFGVSRLGKN